MTKKYPIDTIEDILDVPEEHLDELLSDIKVWYKTVKPIIALAKTLGDPNPKSGGFAFVPDGLGESRIRVEFVEHK